MSEPTDSNNTYSPASWTVAEVREALRAADGGADLPTFEDASRWEAITSDGPTGDYASLVVDTADSKRGEPVSRLPATLFADYQRTGTRTRYELAYYDRQRRLALATLAACLERDGRYLDDVLDHAWAICEQTTWLLPAHLPERERSKGLPALRDPADHHVALFSARTAHMLAEADHLLGDRLDAALRDRIRREVEERVLTPYERRDDYHWQQPPTGNWSAVCHAGAAMAALYLEPNVDRLAALVVKAVSGLEQYLDSFGTDGCTPEGLSYWNFGFSHYAMLAAALDARTGGRLSLLSPPVLRRLVEFPSRIELSPGRHVPFSDSRESDDVDPYLACWAGARFDVPALTAAGRRGLAATDRPFFGRMSDSLVEAVRNLCWCERSAVARAPTPDRQYFFSDAEWWIARSNPSEEKGLVVAAKAGHNGEPHNHNDCGSFVVHCGGESSVTDLGFGTYDRDYFSENRYESLTARSLGHSVPYVNGHEQAVGREHAATVLACETSGDAGRFEMDLTDCYPADSGVASLTRSLRLDRQTHDVTLTDTVSFSSGVEDPSVESVFVTHDAVEETADGVAIRGNQTRTTITFDPAPTRVAIERLADAVDVSVAEEFEVDSRDVWRTRVAPANAGDGQSRSLAATITPEKREE